MNTASLQFCKQSITAQDCLHLAPQLQALLIQDFCVGFPSINVAAMYTYEVLMGSNAALCARMCGCTDSICLLQPLLGMSLLGCNKQELLLGD